MSDVRVIGRDLARRGFQVHGADASGRVLIRTQLRRGQVLEFVGRQPWWRGGVVAMEACSSAQVWGAGDRTAGARG